VDPDNLVLLQGADLARTGRVAANLLLALACTTILFAVTETVLRARWEPRARTLPPFVKTRTTTREYNVEYETDAQGFRLGAQVRSLKIAVIGDSFVFGSGVARDDVVTSQLFRLLPSYDVRNFGVPGTGPYNALYLWRDIVRDMGPHTVVVAVYAGNDASDALRESREARPPRFVTIARIKALGYRLRAWWRSRGEAPALEAVPTPRPQGWNAFGIENPASIEHLLEVARERGIPADSIRARLDAIPDTLVADALAFRSNPFNLADAVLDPDALRHNLLLDTPGTNDGWRALESALSQLNADVAKAGSRLVLMCIPAAVQVDSTYWWLKNLGVRLDERVLRDAEFQSRLARFAARENIPLIDLLPVMRAHPEQRLYYEQDGHWNAAGHDIAARTAADRIAAILPGPEGMPFDSLPRGNRF
jgi:lysophospholipase L1-like esterase